MVKRKLIAIALICAMSISMAACTDKNGKDGIKTETLSSEEAEQLKRVEFSFEKFNDSADTADDPIEGVEVNLNYIGEDNSSNSDGSNDNSNNNNDNSSNNNNDNNNSSNDNNNNNSSISNDNSNNNNNDNSSNNSNDNNNSNSSSNDNKNNNTSNDNSSDDNNNSSGNPTSTNEEKQQIFWMDLSGDFVFDGEFANAVFKIKDNAPNGTYPVMIKWLDFSNIKAVSLDATGIDGSVVVGGNATETQFKNDGSFEVKADSVSGKPGDTVTVSFRFKNNPGICASVFRFAYDPDILEFDEKASGQGADFANALETQNN